MRQTKMYALHPGSLPPKDPKGKVREEVSADDLAKFYKLKKWEYIVWDPTDEYDYLDFIHLYPSYYGRYTLRPDRTPENDVPCGSHLEKSRRAGMSSGSRAATTRKR